MRIHYKRSEWQYMTGSATYRYSFQEGEKFFLEVRASGPVSVCLVDHDGIPMPIAHGRSLSLSGAVEGYNEVEVFPDNDEIDVFVKIRGVLAETVIDSTPVAVSHQVRPDPVKAQLRALMTEFLEARGLTFGDVLEDEEDEDDLEFGDDFDHWLDQETPYMEEDFPEDGSDELQPEVESPPVGGDGAEAPDTGAEAPPDSQSDD